MKLQPRGRVSANGNELSGPKPVIGGVTEVRPLGSNAGNMSVVSPNRTAPVDPAQEALWRLDQAHPENSDQILVRAFRLRGRLDRDALATVLRRVVNRHASLRTSFLLYEQPGRGGPRRVVQIVTEQPHPPLEFDYFGARSEENGRDLLCRILAEERLRVFDLARGPLFRARHLQIDEEDSILLLSAHPIVADRTSLEMVVHELSVLYSEAVEGSVSESAVQLAEPGGTYCDFATWRRGWLTQARASQQLNYWRGRIAGILPVVVLPSDHSRASMGSLLGAARDFALPAGVVPKLRRLAEEEAVPVAAVLLGAFKNLLQWYTGETDVLVACTSDPRREAGLSGVAGRFENKLLLRTDLSGRPTFREAIQRVWRTYREALANQDVPFDRVLEEVQPDLYRTRAQPCQVTFDWLEASPAALRLAAVEVAHVEAPPDGEAAVSLWEDGETIRGVIRYRPQLFDAPTVDGFADCYLRLLSNAIAKPDERIPELAILSGAEREEIVCRWNSTVADYPRGLSIHGLIEAQAERTPETIAVVFGDARLTYSQLNARANQLARHLRRRGVQAGTLVGIHVQRSLEMLVAVLASLKAGGAYVPLDPSFPEDRVAYMIADSRMPVLVTQQRLSARLPARPAEVVCLDSDAAEIAGESPENLSGAGAVSESLAYVLYTSGSTGRPKGVQIPHRAVVNFLCSMAREPGLASQDVLLGVTTLSFDIAGLELYLPLVCGARLVLASSQEASDGCRLAKLMDSHGVTVMQATPATWRLLLEAGWRGNPRLKILCGGEALSRPLADKLLLHCGSLWNMYGPTETTIWSTIWRVEPGDGPILIGRPIANTRTYVLNADLKPVPVGVAGELYIGGDGLTRGYLNQPELTAQSLIPDPLSRDPEARLYRTGDLARYRRDGNIEFISRADQQVKVRGFRIELGEMEAVLAGHPGIAESVVIAREDTPGSKQLVAYFVPARATDLKTSELRGFLKEKLPDYMLPSAFVVLPALPRTPNGKTDRRALPAPARERPDLAREHVPPRNGVERRLVAIWEDILKVRPIGITDDYFDFGADSLTTARVFARIGRQFGPALQPTVLFQAPTIEQLAKLLDGETGSRRWTCLQPVQTEGSRSPLFCVHGGAGTILFFHDLAKHLGDGLPLYALQAQGLYGDALPHARVEEMAAHYLNEIRTVQDKGPYYLVGYCFGAIVAYEMAQRLRAEGQEVAFLASLNGPVPRYQNGPGAGDARLVDGLGSGLVGALRRRARRARSFLRRMRRKSDRLRVRFCRWRGVPLPDGLRDRYFLVNNHRAEFWYRAEPYPGKMTIFRAKGLYYDPFMGWTDLVTGGLEVHEIPGAHIDHRSMMEEPIVKLLARELRQALARLEPAGQRGAN